MKHIVDQIEQLARQRLLTRLKHLRGQHDQRDHAWNRGMGGGGGAGVDLGPNQMGPLPTMQMYREQRLALMDQHRQGDITREEMRRQIRDLRGMTTGEPLNNVVLANQDKRSLILSPESFPEDDTINKFFATITASKIEEMEKNLNIPVSEFSHREWKTVLQEMQKQFSSYSNANKDVFIHYRNIYEEDINKELEDLIKANGDSLMLNPKLLTHEDDVRNAENAMYYLTKKTMGGEYIYADDIRNLINGFYANGTSKESPVIQLYYQIQQDKLQDEYQKLVPPPDHFENKVDRFLALAAITKIAAITDVYRGTFPIESFSSVEWKQVLDEVKSSQAKTTEDSDQKVVDHYQSVYDNALEKESKYTAGSNSTTLILDENDFTKETDKNAARMAKLILGFFMEVDVGEFEWLISKMRDTGLVRSSPEVYAYYAKKLEKQKEQEREILYQGLEELPKEFSNGAISADTFIAESDALGLQYQYEIDTKSNITPILWSNNEFDDYLDKCKNFADYFYSDQEFDRTAKRVAEEMQKLGASVDDTVKIFAMTEAPQSKLNGLPYEGIYDTVLLHNLHNKRAEAVSKMSEKEQNEAYKKLKRRIDERNALNAANPRRDGRRLSNSHVEMVNDLESLLALGIYGNPDLRLAIASDAYQGEVPDYKRIRRLNGSINAGTPMHLVDDLNISDTIKYYSFEYRLLMAKKRTVLEIPKYPVPYTNEQDLFIQNFIHTHANQTTTNSLGAAIQTAMSRIGPNADAPPAKSFYLPGITPPEPHPTILKYLQAQYEETQKQLAMQKITSERLYRGTKYGPANGIPMAPWSTERTVGSSFSGNAPKRKINVAQNMLAKYIFMNHKNSLFVTNYENEEEWLVLETAALEKSDGTDGLAYLYEWTIKQLNQQRKSRVNVFDEANGVVDYSIISAYEPQYNIFYNYYDKPKATTKQLLKRIKNIRNK